MPVKHTAIAAACALLLICGSASAQTLSVNAQFYRITWSPMNFISETPERTSISCPVTLEGSFNRTTVRKGGEFFEAAKNTAVRFGSCTGGTIQTLQNETGGVLIYRSFAGTLPAITSVTFSLVSFWFRWGWIITCLYNARSEQPIGLQFVRNTSTSQITQINNLPERISEPSGCPSIFTSGTATIARAGTTEGFFIRLI
ncbi:MAG TPA: hypothetical protein VFU94_05160 [Conexibacter sp.]|nr:hypothetical protein [Conexibacter sp.]